MHMTCIQHSTYNIQKSTFQHGQEVGYSLLAIALQACTEWGSGGSNAPPPPPAQHLRSTRYLHYSLYTAATIVNDIHS